MSDLQCPATLLIVPTGERRGQVPDLVKLMSGRRVAAVYTSRMQPAVESAQRAASELGLHLVLVDKLDERFPQSIGEIADLHRGETVLVFTHGEVKALAILLAAQLPNPAVVETAFIEIEVDGDGWRLARRGSPAGSDPEQEHLGST